MSGEPWQPAARRDWFQSTRWSLVQAAGDTHDPDAREALAELCQIYWPSVYAYIRSRGEALESAQDLTQGFFAEFLEKRYFKDARRDRGRFRAFLLTCVKHYTANERDRARAEKRGGGTSPVRLDLEQAESLTRNIPSGADTPDRIFERQWALTLLDRTLARLDEEAARSGHPERFQRLKPFLTDSAAGARYQDVAGELGMTVSAVKVAMHRLRRKFGSLLREEVAQTVADGALVDEEIRFLFQALA